MTKLSEILRGVKIINRFGDLDIEIQGITDDSREVKVGYVFVCIPKAYESEYARWTYRTDGHDYVSDAIRNGASAIIIQKPMSEISQPKNNELSFKKVAFVQVDDTRVALAKMSIEFHDNPSRKLKVIGVTGTNGKTSTCYLARSILAAGGIDTAILGTIIQHIGGKDISANMTTIEAHRLQKILHDIVKEGLEAVVMEVSSHALELKRADGIEFDAAVFTNLTQDHLDFHNGMTGYLEAKTKLFRDLGIYNKKAYAIINADDPYSEYIMQNTSAEVITYAVDNKADVKVKDYHSTADGLSFWVSINKKDEVEVKLQLLGEYNLYNALAAMSIGISQGLSMDVIKYGLENTGIVPGRFERVDCGQDFTVVVDYAHTPDALERALTSARKLAKSKIITVFGCGGDRDRGKRPIMGDVVTKLSDYAIVTSDNPRTEDPMEIISQILAGITNGEYEVIPDRRDAIRRAIEISEKWFFVVIAGKGHEDYQIIKGEKIHFDDREVAREAIETRT